MSNNSFVQYWTSDDVHDGRIRLVVVEGDRVRVSVETYEGRLVVFEFAGVQEVKQNRPEGMLLYSLAELNETAPLRRFVFANWDDEDEAYLEIIALEVSSVAS